VKRKSRNNIKRYPVILRETPHKLCAEIYFLDLFSPSK